MAQYWYGLACVPECVEASWRQNQTAIAITCDASGSPYYTTAVVLTPQPSSQDYLFARRQYVVAVHALYFKKSGRAELTGQTIAQLIGLRCERIGLTITVRNDNESQSLETGAEHSHNRVCRVRPWSMPRRQSVRQGWCSFMQAAYRLPPVELVLCEELPAADSWARGPRASRGTERMPQSRVCFKTCRWCLWAHTSLNSRL